MLAKKNRLRKKKDFERVFKKGKGFRNNILFLKFLETGLEESRFGFVVSNKVSKKAVVRNKVKRRLREAVRNKLGRVKKGVDVVFMALSGIEEKSFQDIEQSINKLFQRAEIMNFKS